MLEDANLTEEDVEKSNERTWSSMMTVAGTEYATSLFWQPLQNRDDPYQEVEEASQGIMEGADLFCIKPGKAPQFGICVSEEGFRKGMDVAAVALATALSDRSSLVAVFKVENGWWYVCIRNDIILSDGDMLFLNEEDARNQFESMLAVPDWGRRIAPPEWGYEDTEYPDLEKILARGGKAKLKKIKALRGTKLVMVVVISISVGFYLLSNILSEIFFAPPKRPPVTVPIVPKAAPPVQKLPEIKPWEKVKDPFQVMTGCQNAVVKLLGVVTPGWEIGQIKCSDNAAQTAWKRKVGQVSWIKKALEDSGVKFGGIIYSDTGEQATVSLQFGPVAEKKSPPAYSNAQLRLIINDFFQGIGQRVSMTNSSFTSPEHNVYRSIVFKFSSKYKPVVWRDLLMKFSGLEIKSITYTPSTKQWDYEGAIYVL